MSAQAHGHVDFAVRGERGVDIFRRSDDASARRARYDCLGCVIDAVPAAAPQVLDYSARFLDGEHDRLRAMADKLPSDSMLTQSFCLGDTTGWPHARQAPDPLAGFLYLDFFRAWQVADMALCRFVETLEATPDALPNRPHAFPSAVTPAFQFNRLALACRIATAALPVLTARLDAQGNHNDAALGVGFGMRMLGDLALRAGTPDLALRCFELSVAAGDNQHRRAKTIEAAVMAGDDTALARHLDAFATRWPLQPWMTQLGGPDS